MEPFVLILVLLIALLFIKILIPTIGGIFAILVGIITGIIGIIAGIFSTMITVVGGVFLGILFPPFLIILVIIAIVVLINKNKDNKFT